MFRLPPESNVSMGKSVKETIITKKYYVK